MWTGSVSTGNVSGKSGWLRLMADGLVKGHRGWASGSFVGVDFDAVGGWAASPLVPSFIESSLTSKVKYEAWVKLQSLSASVTAPTTVTLLWSGAKAGGAQGSGHAGPYTPLPAKETDKYTSATYDPSTGKLMWAGLEIKGPPTRAIQKEAE
jgi:hypothetical protein